MQRPLRVLSLDGGGLKGVFSARILATLEERLGKPLNQVFDLIIGTSTGGIIALAMGVSEFSAEDCCELYKELGKRAFKRKALFPAHVYRHDILEEILKEKFGEKRLDEPHTHANGGRCKVAVVSVLFNHTPSHPVLFKNYADHEHPFDRNDVTVWQAARGTSAAPTYFSPMEIKQHGMKVYYQDGGLVANNPAMFGLTEIKKIAGDASRDVLIVSVGTTNEPTTLNEQKNPNLNLVSLAGDVISCSMDANSAATERQVRALLPKNRYFRINHPAATKGMDNPECIPTCNAAALTWLAENHETCNEIVRLLQ